MRSLSVLPPALSSDNSPLAAFGFNKVKAAELAIRSIGIFLESFRPMLAPISPIEISDAGVKLAPAPIELSWIIDGNPQARACLLSKSADRSAWTIVWECTKGRFHWYYDLDETIMILDGAIILESDILPPTRYGAGSVILFRKGAHARWYVEDYVKKLAFCRRAQPLPLSFALRALAFLKRKVVGAAKQGGALSPLQMPSD